MSSAGQPRILAGRYRLEQVIGRGGMSTVYRATDLSLDRTVAVKVALDPQAEENPVYVARFKREARAAAALNHSGAVTVFDAGADGPTRYIVMEFVDGRSLADILREQDPPRPLEPRRAARIAEQIADTLVAAHAAGIVHRDIKPGNVMVEAADRVKVLDFGIARTSDAVALTRTASVLGTAPYMAPEQAMGNPADARSDIYSLGCVLFEMLTGEPPFMADVAAAVLHQHVHVQPKAPSERNPAVPPALDALVLEMLAKAPNDRPQTAAEVRDRLAASETGARTGPTAPLTAATEVLAAAAADAAAVPQIATVQQTPTVPPDRVAATADAAAVAPAEPRPLGVPGRDRAAPARCGGRLCGGWRQLEPLELDAFAPHHSDLQIVPVCHRLDVPVELDPQQQHELHSVLDLEQQHQHDDDNGDHDHHDPWHHHHYPWHDHYRPGRDDASAARAGRRSARSDEDGQERLTGERLDGDQAMVRALKICNNLSRPDLDLDLTSRPENAHATRQIYDQKPGGASSRAAPG